MKQSSEATTTTIQGRTVDRGLKALDWPMVIERLLGWAKTGLARARIEEMVSPDGWAQNLAAAQLRHQEVKDIGPTLSRDFYWSPLSGLEDIRESLEAIQKDRVIELKSLAEVRAWLIAIDAWAEIPPEEISGNLLGGAVAQLPSFREPLGELSKILSANGEIKDSATPLYQSLIAEVRSVRSQIRARMEELAKQYYSEGVLQESYTDVRDGRHVLAVKIASQSKVKGRVFDSSATQQTVYVEPREVEELDHRLAEAESKLRTEIFRILQQACRIIAPYVNEVEFGMGTLAHWDFVQARARLGLQYGGKPMQVVDENRILLLGTAHPLLWGNVDTASIVRNDLEFGPPTSAILFTGPNTGGKTILLKTLGLAAVFARVGIPFPARTEPVVPFFEEVFVDLGDPQSIEDHLSSFAGHLLRFKDILERVNSRSLILLDELNSATDPEEGAALSRAVLESLLDRKVSPMVVVTTHDPQLKALALENDRMLNASLEFDEETYLPTYRVVFGVPGRSRALETAERLGLPAEVLERAKNYVSRQHSQFEDLISRLEGDAHAASKARRQAERMESEARAREKEWKDKATKGVAEELEQTRRRLSDLYKETNDKIRALLGTLTKKRSHQDLAKVRETLGGIVNQAMDQSSGLVEEEMPDAANAAKELAEQRRSLLPTLKVGAEVRVPKWKKNGIILEVSGEQVKVRLGGMMTVNLSVVEVEPTGQMTKSTADKRSRSTVVSISNESVGHEIDLRGIRFEEAMGQLGVYLDRAYSNGLNEVTVIHGVGTGAIREGTREYLSSVPFVKTFADGGCGRGNAGATIVSFDR